MNLMSIIVLSEDFVSENERVNRKINFVRKKIKEHRILFSNKSKKVGTHHMYKNVLPIITELRDVLKKPTCVCKMQVNWNNKSFKDAEDAYSKLKEQWGFIITTVDAEHTRNNYKNLETITVVFDDKERALLNMGIFNSMFRTAIEQDAINEYKRFKENPQKRPLTFDKIIPNAYELYELVDNNED